MTRQSRRRAGPGGQRQLRVRVKTARSRTPSSQRWLERQLNDPYVAAAKREGWRSRAAYKLKEIDDKYRFLKPGMRVVDLGAAPGGWSRSRPNACGDRERRLPAGRSSPSTTSAWSRCRASRWCSSISPHRARRSG